MMLRWVCLALFCGYACGAAADLFLRPHIQTPQAAKENVHCVGEVTQKCGSGYCYDAVNRKDNRITSGCASIEMCTKSECKLFESQYICCCTGTVCNGKTASLLRSRMAIELERRPKPHVLKIDKMARLSPRLAPRDVRETDGKASAEGKSEELVKIASIEDLPKYTPELAKKEVRSSSQRLDEKTTTSPVEAKKTGTTAQPSTTTSQPEIPEPSTRFEEPVVLKEVAAPLEALMPEKKTTLTALEQQAITEGPLGGVVIQEEKATTLKDDSVVAGVKITPEQPALPMVKAEPIIKEEPPKPQEDREKVPEFGVGAAADESATSEEQNAGESLGKSGEEEKEDEEEDRGSKPKRTTASGQIDKADSSSNLWYIVGGVGIVLIVVGIIGLVVTRNRSRKQPQRRPKNQDLPLVDPLLHSPRDKVPNETAAQP
ncbi:unnamed protein product, partial [Mesorhabditis spiculigera]